MKKKIDKNSGQRTDTRAGGEKYVSYPDSN